MCIDDFQMIPGHGECELGQYLCGDGQCINSTWRCDGKQDCLDMSDEDWRAGCTSQYTINYILHYC